MLWRKSQTNHFSMLGRWVKFCVFRYARTHTRKYIQYKVVFKQIMQPAEYLWPKSRLAWLTAFHPSIFDDAMTVVCAVCEWVSVSIHLFSFFYGFQSNLCICLCIWRREYKHEESCQKTHLNHSLIRFICFSSENEY